MLYYIRLHARAVLRLQPSNYCTYYYTYYCTGALLCFDSNLDYVAKQFEAVPHPPVRCRYKYTWRYRLIGR